MSAPQPQPLPILLRGDARLEQRCAPVERVDHKLDDTLHTAAARMHATLDAFRSRSGYGRALAAPQVGLLQRVIVMNLRDALSPPSNQTGASAAVAAAVVTPAAAAFRKKVGPGPFTLINPHFTWLSDDTIDLWDDCLSIPDLVVHVRRRASLTVKFRDLDWREHTWACVPPDISELLQHEVDHLDGILMTERAHGPDAIRPISDRDALVAPSRRAASR
jgi:peptide deformylase